MIEVYKHFHTYDQDLLPDDFQKQSYGMSKHAYQLVWKKAKDGVRGKQANSFYFRIIKMWNYLPAETVDANTINSFKNRLDDAWKSDPFKYNPKPTSSS